jgi:2,3-dihydroxy-p-cumate/2,3-dihydroxybenzoate 3,4-dioxygenase
MDTDIRYEKLGYVALNVTDLDRSAAFYRDHVGLNLTAKTDGVAYLRCSRDHHNIALYPAKAPGVKRVGYEVESEAVIDRLIERFSGLGLAVEEASQRECQALGQSRTIRVREPASGLQFEFYNTQLRMAAEYAPPHANIARLGHLVLWLQDAYEPMLKFVLEVLNFRASDHFGDRLTFLRCFPNPYHHTFAIGRGDRTGLHHVNFMVTDIDDIGRAIHRLNKNNVTIAYGPGRHPPSGSIFLYYLDPDGLTLEYSFGMEEFPEENPRKPFVYEPVQSSLDYWGSPKHPRYAQSGAIEVPDSWPANRPAYAAQ